MTGTDPRPVIILGPFAQALIQKLVHESHDKYVEYEGELLNTENTVIEKGIADGVFVNYRKVNDLFEVTRTHKLHEIANSVSSCFLFNKSFNSLFIIRHWKVVERTRNKTFAVYYVEIYQY